MTHVAVLLLVLFLPKRLQVPVGTRVLQIEGDSVKLDTDPNHCCPCCHHHPHRQHCEGNQQSEHTSTSAPSPHGKRYKSGKGTTREAESDGHCVLSSSTRLIFLNQLLSDLGQSPTLPQQAPLALLTLPFLLPDLDPLEF